MEHPAVLQLIENPEKMLEYKRVEKYFQTKYGCLPEFYVRVPGRVNLIGEHIDYCGFDVLPMAIEQDIVLAVATNGDKTLKLANMEHETYSDFSCDIDQLEISSQSGPKWHHYFMCGVKGICEDYKTSSAGMDVVVFGRIPPSAGLSSSSAMVCSAALATAHANGISISKMEIADICARCERYIGTQGGGMDQAIVFLAEPGTAKLIEFNPLKATNVKLPPGANFIVANSCVPMNKAATSHYNTRVVECRLAAKVLAKLCGLDTEKIHKLSDLPIQLQCPLSCMIRKVQDHLHEDQYTRSEICDLLGISDNELESLYCCNRVQGLKLFKLYQRSSHVYQEANRVHVFKEICDKGSDDALQKLGELMNQSHRSCRDLYECSHPQLDDLVNIALGAGAIGSRLTGAGWGGCCVSLVSNENIARFMDEVNSKFYAKHNGHATEMINANIFVTQPGRGALIFK